MKEEKDTVCEDQGSSSGLTNGQHQTSSKLTNGHSSKLANGHTSKLTNGHSSELTNGHSSELTNGHSSELTNGHTSELTNGHSSELTNGHTSEMTNGHTSELTNGHPSSPEPMEEEKNSTPSKSKAKAKKSKTTTIKGQSTIMQAFSNMSKRKREVEEVQEPKVEVTAKDEPPEEGETPQRKRAKATVTKEKPKPQQSANCGTCRQPLDQVQLYPGDSKDAVEEFIMLTNPKLSVYEDMDADLVDVTERPQHKLTNFSVYDSHTHLCPFDSGLIEKNIEIFFSGVVKPIFEDDPRGIDTANMGPINEWWISGFDGGERAILGFSTSFADYILMTPSEIYKPFMRNVTEKIHLSKIVIEYLCSRDDINTATYEDLLNHVETRVPPQDLDLMTFTEDTVLQHAQFIVDQVQGYDSTSAEMATSEDEDPPLITAPCVRALINLAGVTLGKRQVPTQICMRAMRRHRQEIVRDKKNQQHTLATTTPLVRSIFEIFFTNQLDIKKGGVVRKGRCGVCEPCQQPDCGNCKFCRDMVKFGGSGRSKQACLKRRCPNMMVQEANENDPEEEPIEDEVRTKSALQTEGFLHKARHQKNTAVKWLGQPCLTDINGNKYYRQVQVNNETLEWGEYVLITPDNPSTPTYPARIHYMWETHAGVKLFHCQWFLRGSETILGETSDPTEVFSVLECESESLNVIHSKCKVLERPPPPDWAQLGGAEDTDQENKFPDDGKTFFHQKSYHMVFGRFEDPPKFSELIKETDFKKHCPSCHKIDTVKEESKPQLLDLIEENQGKSLYRTLLYKNMKVSVGDSIYLSEDAFEFDYQTSTSPKKQNKKKQVDELVYPEYYRKSDSCKMMKLDIPEPFKVGYVSKIYQKSRTRLVVNKFYRPGDTHLSKETKCHSDLNLLYWSNEEAEVELADIVGKCLVTHEESLKESLAEYTIKGPNRFYFTEAFDSENQSFVEPPNWAKSRTKGKLLSHVDLLINIMLKLTVSQGKGKGKGKSSQPAPAQNSLPAEEDSQFLHPNLERKLRAMDIFAGCGAGLADTRWAVEKEEPAAHAFRLNFPDATVFTDDCNILLKMVMDGKVTNGRNQKLPQKGDVELLCGGPPCQGFSGMNRFNSREYSFFKNSLVVSYLSYCDYYRPRYFVLENVRNFVCFKQNLVLKLTLACLVRMGYQCTFTVLQAGNFGVPQTRRRAFIIAAAPGYPLPHFPQPTHTFSPRYASSFLIGGRKQYGFCNEKITSAPFRNITVRDAISDLPEIRNGARIEEMSYTGEPRSHFQKLMRGSVNQSLVRDHICKEMSALVEARMRHIPVEEGSDWRDLPNIEVRLNDGTYTKKLEYRFKDKKNGKSKDGHLRGVCPCADGKQCDPLERQDNTLIPWCLPHTGNRHNHWAGLYGRLAWNGFFFTTITNPEPMGKQGRTLHPEQHRLVSVRECARSQGFPDKYRFYGNILDRHRQVGNAVPPPLAAAIGLQIAKCVAQSSH
ncbi:DNMT1 [Cordylochernes scorpioides]|uniref:DNA (cytosine-5)-methyltransferase n=1 Tax=Cordylochernes scorpioides TaxID=51811 RepID=A0ABY6K3S2_9ARAC|nr:DNMT1 [Cordylochernes scorpioides]